MRRRPLLPGRKDSGRHGASSGAGTHGMDLQPNSRIGVLAESGAGDEAGIREAELLEIPPEGDSAGSQQEEAAHEVVERVMRRAEELRKSWAKANGTSTRVTSRAHAAVTG